MNDTIHLRIWCRSSYDQIAAQLNTICASLLAAIADSMLSVHTSRTVFSFSIVFPLFYYLELISHFSIIAFLFSFAYAYIVKTNIFLRVL